MNRCGGKRSRWLARLRRLAPARLGGACAPPAASLAPQWGRLAPSPGGCGRGSPGGFAPPSLARLGLRCACPKPSAVVRGWSRVARPSLRWRAPAPFLRSPRPPLRRCASLAARVRFGAPRPPPLRAPLRRLAPSLRSAGSPLGRAPPAPPLGACAGLLRCALRALSLPPLRLGCPRCAAGVLRCAAVALAPARASPCASRVARRVPPAPARFAASGAGGSRPGGFGAASPRSVAPAPGAWFARRACAAALSPPAGAVKIIASDPLCGSILTAPASGDV